MQFGSDFFKTEKRCDFEISSEMKHYWAAGLELLDFLQNVCGEFGLTYYAAAGTLLGAVRHGGFVPWDDDMDIYMMRKDFNMLMRVLPDCLPPYIVLNCNRVAPHGSVISNIANGHSVPLPQETIDFFHGCPYVAGIDIFVLDNVPRDIEQRKSQFLLVGTIYKAICAYNNELSSDEIEHYLQIVEEACNISFERDGKVLYRLIRLFDEVISMFDDSEADEVAVYHDLAISGAYRPLKREYFGGGCLLPFENTWINVPVGYNNVLKVALGDSFMTPLNTGGTHGYPIYKEQKAYLKKMGYMSGDE